ncbi:MAG: hypothetical protein FWD81_04760, partial [Methanomassiliicoccaceae archaeon]|nr:hypothetical protein [Methanomassiliicoccaceae archaeon]
GAPFVYSSGTTTMTVEDGALVAFYASEGTGHTFSRWVGTVNSTELSIPAAAMTANIAVNAIFILSSASNTITLEIIGNGTVTVTIDGQAFTYTSDAVMTVESGITAAFSAAGGYEHWFYTWTNDLAGHLPASLLIDGDKVVGAKFSADSAPSDVLKSLSPKGGKILWSSDGITYVELPPELKVPVGETVYLKAVPDEGMKLSKWLGSLSGSDLDISFVMPDHPMNIDALFILDIVKDLAAAGLLLVTAVSLILIGGGLWYAMSRKDEGEEQ